MEERVIPTKIEGYVDHDWMPLLREAIKAGDRILLVGHCGTGKTSSIEQIGAEEEQEVFKVNLHGQTTVSDLIGEYIVKGSEVIWKDGIAVQALRRGAWFIMDEVDFAEPEILAVLHGLLEDGGRLVLSEKDGEVVYGADGFRIFGTANTIGANMEDRSLYQGTNPMNEAFLDRWNFVYQVGYPAKALEVRILKSRVADLPNGIAHMIVNIAAEIRDAFFKDQVMTTFSPRKCLQWAEKVMRYGDMKMAAEMAIYNKLNKEDREVVSGVVQRWLGGGN